MRFISLFVLFVAFAATTAAQTVSAFDHEGTLHQLDASADTDGDGIENALEINGFEFDLLSGELVPWDGDPEARYFITDPLRVSTDGDPYSDLQEATGANMPSSVQPPYNHPLVAARPVIAVYMSSYDVIPNGTITNGQGGSESESFTNETSNEQAFSVGLEGTVEFSPASLGSVTMSTEYSQTWVNTSSTTSSESFDWSSARAVNEAEAAFLRLNVYYVNNGSAPASNVRPTFTLQLGNKTIATFIASANSEANSLVPGGRFPQNGSIAIDRYVAGEVEVQISLTLNELKAIQLGAPLRLTVPQVEATIQRWDPATQSYGTDVTWTEFEDDIDPVSLTVEAVVDGEPKQVQIYAPIPGTFGETRTVGEALSLAFDVDEGPGGTTIDGRSYPLDWYLSTDSGPLYDNWVAAGRPANLLGIEAEAGARLAMLSSSNGQPRVDFASHSRDLRQVYASALPINGFPIRSAKATLYGRERTFEIELDDNSFGAFLANSVPIEEPYYGGVVTVINARGEARVETIALPSGPTRFRTCADIQASDPAARGGTYPLFMTGRMDRPVLVECQFSEGGPPIELPWTVRPGQPDDLRTLRVVDETTLVGITRESGFRISRSIDAGQTWTPVRTGTATSMGDIEFVDAMTGFAAGSTGPTNRSPSVLRTRDGGASWIPVESGLVGFTTGAMYAVGVLDPQTVVVAGQSGDILLSTDGGQNWRPIYTAGGGSIGELEYLGGQGSTLIVAQQTSNLLRVSEDDGATWSEIRPYERAGVPPGVILNMDFVNTRVGFVVAGWSTQAGVINNTALLKTEDGGATWREVPVPTSDTFRGVRFLDEQSGFLGGTGQQVFHTVDGGTTWYGQRAGNRGNGVEIDVRDGLAVLRTYTPSDETDRIFVTRSVDYSEGPGGVPHTIKPRSLLVYDGVPTRAGGASTASQAQDVLDDYGVVILGEGRELVQNHPSSQDYLDMHTMVQALTAGGTEVYGTIDIGVTTANLPLGNDGPTEGPNTAVIYRVLYWAGEGYANTTGVVLKNAGAQYGVDRARRCEAIRYVRATFQSRVILTGLTPEEVFADAEQPCGVATPEEARPGVGDAVLIQGYQVRDDQFVEAGLWRAEAQEWADAVDPYGVRLMSLATGEAYSDEAFRYAWFSGLVDEHRAIGWADADRGASDNRPLAFVAPEAEPGRTYFDEADVDLPTVQRSTEGGIVTINTSTRTVVFGAAPVTNEEPLPESVFVLELDPTYPNPTRGRATIPFRLSEPGPVRLAIYDLLGREVALLVDDLTSAGAHEVRFDARGLASGMYIVRLSASDQHETRRMTVVR